MPQTLSVPTDPTCLAQPRLGRIALLVGLVLSLGVVLRVQAATTWTVCASGCTYTSIKAAIATPTTMDGDTLAIAAGVYTEPDIRVHKSLTLQGEEAATTIVQAAATQATASDRVFTIASGVTVTLQELTIRYGHVSNIAAGGGLYNAGTLTLIDSTVRGNGAAYGGGGLYNDYTGTLTLTHSTVRSNDAGNGGGLFNGGTLTLTHSTVSGNKANNSGGGLVNYGTLTLTHSIVASNPLGRDCHNFQGSITSQGYNLASDTSCQLTDSTDLPASDPQLGPLQDNSGPTLTQALLPGSPAIDAIPWGTHGCGTTIYSDQRWQARPQPAGGACDIGAYEVDVTGQALAAWVSGMTPQTAVCENVTTGQALTLNDPAPVWDCEAAGLGVTAGDQVAVHVRGPVAKGATDVSGAVVGMAPSSGGCTNRTTGQHMAFQRLVGATAASCVAAGLVMDPRDTIQISVQGVAQ